MLALGDHPSMETDHVLYLDARSLKSTTTLAVDGIRDQFF